MWGGFIIKKKEHREAAAGVSIVCLCLHGEFSALSARWPISGAEGSSGAEQVSMQLCVWAWTMPQEARSCFVFTTMSGM